MKPYPKYKNSNIPWLGDVPEHWEVNPGLSLFRENKNKNIGLIEKQVLSLSYGKIVIKPQEKLHGLVPESFESYQIVEPGDIIIRSTDLQNDKVSLRTGLVKNKGIITSAYICLCSYLTSNYKFISWLLHGLDLMKVFYGLGSGLRQNLSWRDFKRLLLPVPPLPEQQQIARYLDWKTAKINKFIRNKKKLVGLLKEQKQAIINDAVTGRIDVATGKPYPEYKPSGIDWLGDIPKDWNCTNLSKYVEIKDGTHDTPPYINKTKNSFPLITSKFFYNGFIDFDKAPHISLEWHELIYSRSNTQSGDILMSMIGGNIGSCIYVDTSRMFSIKNVALFKTSNSKKLNGYYLLHLLKSSIVTIQIANNQTGGGQPFIGLGNIRKLFCTFPNLSTQKQIVSYIEKETFLIDQTIEKAKKEIELIQEYRTRLISNAVTGQIDVRDIAVPDFEEVEAEPEEEIEENEEELIEESEE